MNKNIVKGDMMSDSNEIHIMRFMAWERAKGELKSMLHCYWNDIEPNIPKEERRFNKLDKVISEFIQKVEDEGLHE